MSKELFVSSTPHETKVAIVEDDQLTEVYFERENEYTLAGSIYKGRVTRVLPGMQSAFVNIGLERDAFLYVSDFLLEEDEDAEVLDQVVPRGAAVVIQEPEQRTEGQQEPIEAQEVFPPAELADEEDQPDAAAAEQPSAEEPEREGARRWRGRRRRGRGRDRFQERGDREQRDQRDQLREQRPVEAAHEARTEAPPAPRDVMVLPGESISKYQPHSEQQAPARPQAAPAPQRTVRPSTEYSIDPLQYSANANVLPGESLAKYRNVAPVVQAPVETAPQVEAAVQEAATIEHSEPPVAAQVEQEEQPHEAAPAATFSEDGHAEASASHAAEDAIEKREERLESMNVASVFGGDAVEPEAEEAEAPTEETAESAESADSVEQVSGANASASPSGVVEEEEIEEEELEIPDFDEERLDLADYEELEEEELQPLDDQMVAMGREITEAIRDAHVNEHATGQYEAEGLQNGEAEEEFVDAADEAHEEALAEVEEQEEQHEPAERTSAEVRAPGGTAGFQQRTERTPDRRGGRRFGRRMRGRPRHYVQRQLPAISDLLKEGQEILVQIAKEPIAKKGARITSHIALPGRFLVYMPTVHHTGVSRKIASEEERHRLKRIVLSERGEAHGGFIVRTAASGANEDDLRADIRFLINLWNEIRGRAEKSKAPALIYHDLNLVERILRDQVTISFSSIMVDSEQEYERVLRFVSRFQPSLVKRVKLYTKDTPLFEEFNVSEEINKALKSKVWLKSGGYIVINQTEALVAIDVNTGKYVGKTARLEDTIVKTNIDAIREIVRQIRLRDLGGIIVIDFIDMDERKNRQRVMQALEEALKGDRAPSKVLQFNDFGLVAITRKRVKQSLERTLGQQCPICTGTGMIKSVSTVCNEIYVEMRKMSRHFDHDIMLRVNPDVGKALKANGARWLQEMEELTKRSILVKSDALLHPEQFDIQ